jgi:hypothetical protein
MPLEAEPVENGNIAVIDGKAHVFRGELFEEMIPEGPRFINHFATCPKAADFKRSKDKD